MMDSQPQNPPRLLAELAGIRLPGEREAALAAGLEATRRIVEALARCDYGETEPACRFRAPGGDER